MLTYGGLKQHIILALGGQPSVVTGVTQSQRIAEIINQAGQYLFTKSWRFRERTARPLSIVAGQNWAALPGDAEDIISLTCKAGLGWNIELTSPEKMELMRTSVYPALSNSSYYAAMSRPWADSSGVALVDGTGLPAIRLELYPTPQSSSEDSIILRYRSAWVPVSTETAESYIIPVPAYVESLLIAYARGFGLAYEDEGLAARLMEIDNGPLFNAAAIKDGIQQRDYGRLPSNRVGPFRRESNSVSSGVFALGPTTAVSNIRWRGGYSGSESYAVGDIVRSGDSAFICVTSVTGIAPPSSEWELVVSDGADGSNGADGADGAGMTANGIKLIGRGVSGIGPVGDITVTTPLKLSGSTLTLLGAGTDAVVPETRSITAGTGLTGGGDLSANRSVSVDFATSGTSSATKAVRADDSRLSDARTPIAHSHDGADITTGTVDTARLLVGSSLGTVCAGDDSRLSNARTPTSHTHGNITNAGAIGSTSGLPIITTASGVLTTGSFSTTTGTFCQGNDSRLSDLRRPVDADYGDITVSGSGTVMTINGGIHQYPKVAPFASFDGYAPAVNGTAASSLTTVANKLYLLPWVAPSDFTVTTLKTRSVTAVTSATVYMAIYASGADGYPTGTPLASAGPLTASAANTDITTSVSVAVTENKQYWFAIGAPASTPPSIRSLGPVALPPLAFSITNGTSYYCIYRTWAQSFASASAADFTTNPVASSDLANSTTVATCPFLVVLK